MPQSILERLTQLQHAADLFSNEQQHLEHLTAKIETLAQQRAESQERLETYRISAELLERAGALLDRLLGSPMEDAEDVNGQLPLTITCPDEPFNSEMNPESISELSALTADEVLNRDADPDLRALPPSEPEATKEPPEETAEQGPYSEIISESTESPVPASARILAYLADHPGLTSRALSEALGMPLKMTSNTVSKLVSVGQVTTLGDEWPPVYRLAGKDRGEADPSPATESLPVYPGPASSPNPRDVADRNAIQARHASPPAQIHAKTRPVTNADEAAVLGALIARPNGKGSAALLSGKAAMSTSRVTEVLEHLADRDLVRRPAPGEHLWSRV